MSAVFGIDDVSNVGRKIVLVWGTAKHYYTFHNCIVSTNNPNNTANHTVTD